MMIAVCLNGCILVEQPYSSYFEFYPRFRDLIQLLQHHGGRGAVARHIKQYFTTVEGLWVHVNGLMMYLRHCLNELAFGNHLDDANNFVCTAVCEC